MRRVAASLLTSIALAGMACEVEGAAPVSGSAVAAAVPATPVAASDVRVAEPTRVVDVGDAPLEGAQPSLDAVGRAIVDALNAEDRSALLGLALSSSEYKERLFGALVQHPNAYQMGPDLLWDMHAAESNGELGRALSRYGGRNLAFEAIAVEREEPREGGVVFHKRPKITAKDADGNRYTLLVVGTIIEHPASGGFKVLGFRNRD